MNPTFERAARRGLVADIERLAGEGADINSRDRHGQTALMIAAREGHVDLVRWLVEHHADLDRTAKYGLSALMLAVIRGDEEVVELLAEAGADLTLKGTGAPGFAGKTALDLAMACGATRIAGALHRRGAPFSPLTSTPYFTAVASWSEAQRLVDFVPVQPRETAGCELDCLRIHVRDHTAREIPVRDRTLEAHYGAFVFSQSRRSPDEARRLAIDVSYGSAPQQVTIHDHDARVYELGPEVPPDDIDGRNPAVVAWHADGMFYLLASARLEAAVLLRIALSIA